MGEEMEVLNQIEEAIEEGLRWNKDLKGEWLRSRLDDVLFRDAGDRPGRIAAGRNPAGLGCRDSPGDP